MFNILQALVIIGVLAIYGCLVVKNLREMHAEKREKEALETECDYRTMFCSLDSLKDFGLIAPDTRPCGCGFAGYSEVPEYQASFIFLKDDGDEVKSTYPMIQRVVLTCPNCKTASVYGVGDKNLSYLKFIRHIFSNTYY